MHFFFGEFVYISDDGEGTSVDGKPFKHYVQTNKMTQLQKSDAECPDYLSAIATATYRMRLHIPNPVIHLEKQQQTTAYTTAILDKIPSLFALGKHSFRRKS